MINYELIAKAIEYYTCDDWKYIDLPWNVESKYIEVTLPPEANKVKLVYPRGNTLYMVGSAEQSFLAYADKTKLRESKKLMSVTPCFRDEEHTTKYSFPYFLKLELFWSYPCCRLDIKETTLEVAKQVQDFMLHDAGLDTSIIETGKDTFDLNCNTKDGPVELGSYGYREYFGFGWIYGTGIAEPRTSLCIKNLS